jgi:hypothetical protein
MRRSAPAVTAKERQSCARRLLEAFGYLDRIPKTSRAAFTGRSPSNPVINLLFPVS